MVTRWVGRRGSTGAADPEAVDLSDQTDDPVEAAYRVPAGMPVIAVPLARLRTSVGQRGDRPDDNPFAVTVRQYLDGDAPDYESSALKAHFERWQPRDIAELLGVSDVAADSPLRQPPVAATVPWSARAATVDVDVRIASRERWTRSDASQYGRRLGVADGHPQFGPVTAAFGAHEFDRYRHVADAVQQQGFRADAGGYVRVVVLADGDRWVARVRAGHHRVAAAIAFGVDPVKVALTPTTHLVRRGEVTSWPGVRSGLFTAAEALAVFDRIMAGEPPAGYLERGR